MPLQDFFMDLPAFTEFCQTMFASLPRSDQRHWGETYVGGLVNVVGRKSVRRIAARVSGNGVEQSLQQFVNQSPWDWQPVRRALVERMVPALQPAGWVIREAVLPKNGSDSPAVARQYAHTAGRILNCQRALGLALIGEEGVAPVTWRLLVPRSRDQDDAHRRKTRLPETERHRPDWQSALELVDDLLAWGTQPAPVVMDVFNSREVYPLVHGLEQRGVRYLLRVPISTPAVPAGPPVQAEPGTVPATLGATVSHSRVPGEIRLSRRSDTSGREVTSRYAVLPITAPAGRGGRVGAVRGRSAMAEWTSGETTRPHTVWLTDLGGIGVVRLVHLAGSLGRAAQELDQFAEESGLRHYEGRSFTGWHHHATLSALAHAFRLEQEVESRRFTGRWLRTPS